MMTESSETRFEEHLHGGIQSVVFDGSGLHGLEAAPSTEKITINSERVNDDPAAGLEVVRNSKQVLYLILPTHRSFTKQR